MKQSGLMAKKRIGIVESFVTAAMCLCLCLSLILVTGCGEAVSTDKDFVTLTPTPRIENTSTPAPTHDPIEDVVITEDEWNNLRIIITANVIDTGDTCERVYLQNSSNNEEYPARLTSTDESICTIDENGYITAIAPGEAGINIKYGSMNQNITITIVPSIAYAYNNNLVNELSEIDQQVLQKACEVLSNIISDEMSEYDKIKAIHDYMVANTIYNSQVAADYRNGIEVTDENAFEARGVVLDGTAVCDGYSKAFSMYMELLNIECVRITGTAKDIPHAWNAVKLDDDWYIVDTTHDDPLPDGGSRVSYDYFLVSDEMVAETHNTDMPYPKCDGTKYLYSVYGEFIIGSVEDYETEFLRQYNEGIRTITILYPGDTEPSLDFIYDIVSSYQYVPAYQYHEYMLLTVIVE